MMIRRNGEGIAVLKSHPLRFVLVCPVWRAAQSRPSELVRGCVAEEHVAVPVARGIGHHHPVDAHRTVELEDGGDPRALVGAMPAPVPAPTFSYATS